MEYDPSDSSGTDDDLPHHIKIGSARGGHITGNGRVAVGFPPYSLIQNDMVSEIHQLGQEAYGSVLRPFKFQSDAITWEKESLITELRKELRVSDEEHRELLSRVNADDIIQRIRDWRQAGGLQSSLLNNAQPVHDPAPSPNISASHKRQKTMVPSLSLGAPSPVLHSQPVASSLKPSSSGAKWGTTAGAKCKKPKPYPSTGPNGKGEVINRSSFFALAPTEHAEPAAYYPLMGQKVMMRWPEDNNFYEAVITDYNARKGLHALVYDMNTMNETWEWVNLNEIPPEDI